MQNTKIIHAFATNDRVPSNAIYLNTKVEKHTFKERHKDYRGNETTDWDISEKIVKTLHYFLVDDLAGLNQEESV